MKNVSCPVEETAAPGNSQAEKVEQLILNNIVVEALAILLTGSIYLAAKAIDLVFHTKAA